MIFMASFYQLNNTFVARKATKTQVKEENGECWYKLLLT